MIQILHFDPLEIRESIIKTVIDIGLDSTDYLDKLQAWAAWLCYIFNVLVH